MFAALAAFFVIGTFGFWIALIVLGIIIFWNIEHEEVGVATLATIVIAALVLWANDISLWTLITTFPGQTLMVIGGYFLAGTLWAVGKWYFYIRRYNHAYNYIKAKRLRNAGKKNVEQFTPSEMKEFRSEVISKFTSLSGKYPYSGTDSFTFPLASERKTAILGWMMYWPYSMTWTLINDPVKRAFITIYQNISGGLDRMTNSLTQDIRSEVKLEREK